MHRSVPRALLAALACLALPAAAPALPHGAPAGPPSARPASAQLDPAPRIEDVSYATRAAAVGLGIAEAGRLGAERGRTPAVRALGADAAAAQEAVVRRLSEALRARGAETPQEPDAASRAALGRLRGLEGIAFDRAFVVEQIRAHEAAAALHSGYLGDPGAGGGGGDPVLRGIAADAAAAARARLGTARAAVRGLRAAGEAATGEAPPGPGPGTIAEHLDPDAVAGRTVLDAAGEPLGTVADVVLEALVVETADGAGEHRRVAIPFGRVRIGTDRPELRTPEISRADLARMPDHGDVEAEGRAAPGDPPAAR